MSDIIDEALSALTGKFGGGFAGRAKFVIAGEGAIMLDGDGLRIGDEAADVTLTADAETFRAILTGETNPTAAFMTGRLTVDGDMGMAMQLGSILV
jgi:putative sterol carrier protein